MGDHKEGKPRSSPLGARMRNALGQVRQQSAASLRGVRRSVAVAGERLKHTQTAERLGAEVEIRRAIKKAADAQERGNHALAYRLLEPEIEAWPEDARVVLAFWNAALACEQVEKAVAPMLHTIRALAGAGEPERAAALWVELRGAIPSAHVEPSALVRIAAALLEEGKAEQAVEALRDSLSSDNSSLSPGLAVRVAEMAHDLDPPTALRAAQRALASPDLHEAKRARLHGLVVALERRESAVEPDGAAGEDAADAAPGDSADPDSDSAGDLAVVASEPTQEPGPLSATPLEASAVAPALEALVPAIRFGEVKVREGMPTGLQEKGLSLQLMGGRKARIEYAAIQALAVAEVGGEAAHPVTIVDLALNWNEPEDPILRVVRLRSDGFDARMVVEASPDRGEAFRAFLADLLARCSAIPLPDPDAVQGFGVRAFDDLESYQREVLQVGS